jgi:hypothetical protein
VDCLSHASEEDDCRGGGGGAGGGGGGTDRRTGLEREIVLAGRSHVTNAVYCVPCFVLVTDSLTVTLTDRVEF